MEFNQPQAIYLQIADLICEKILRKELNPNDKIPSVRDMAVDIAVNPNTVVRTYGYLEEKGIIVKQRGIGYFVADNGYHNTLQLKKDVFVNQDLPMLYKTMRLLAINTEDLEEMFNKIAGEVK